MPFSQHGCLCKIITQFFFFVRAVQTPSSSHPNTYTLRCVPRWHTDLQNLIRNFAQRARERNMHSAFKCARTPAPTRTVKHSRTAPLRNISSASATRASVQLAPRDHVQHVVLGSALCPMSRAQHACVHYAFVAVHKLRQIIWQFMDKLLCEEHARTSRTLSPAQSSALHRPESTWYMHGVARSVVAVVFNMSV